MEGSPTPPPAGWYEDPEDAALQRFWDGTRWTSSRMPRNEAVPLEGDEPAPAPAFRYASDMRPPEGDPADGGSGLPAAAWYQDPENPGGMRYWDGTRWTEDRTDYVATTPKKEVSEGMVAAGYILSFLFPIVGIIIGVVVMNRGNGHGRWIIGLSLLFIAVFIAIGSIEDPNAS